MSLPLFKVMLFFPDLSQQLGLWLKRSSWAYPIDLFWTWKPAVSSTLNVSAADLPSQPAVAVTPGYSWLRSSRYTAFAQRSPTCSPSTLMTVYPEMIHWGGKLWFVVLCNRMEQPIKHWLESQRTKSFGLHSEIIHFLIYCVFMSFTARLAILQIVTDFLGLLRKPGTQQRLQLPQTSGLHAGKQDPTNRWNNFLSSVFFSCCAMPHVVFNLVECFGLHKLAASTLTPILAPLLHSQKHPTINAVECVA